MGLYDEYREAQERADTLKKELDGELLDVIHRYGIVSPDELVNILETATGKKHAAKSYSSSNRTALREKVPVDSFVPAEHQPLDTKENNGSSSTKVKAINLEQTAPGSEPFEHDIASEQKFKLVQYPKVKMAIKTFKPDFAVVGPTKAMSEEYADSGDTSVLAPSILDLGEAIPLSVKYILVLFHINYLPTAWQGNDSPIFKTRIFQDITRDKDNIPIRQLIPVTGLDERELIQHEFQEALVSQNPTLRDRLNAKSTNRTTNSSEQNSVSDLNAADEEFKKHATAHQNTGTTLKSSVRVTPQIKKESNQSKQLNNPRPMPKVSGRKLSSAGETVASKESSLHSQNGDVSPRATGSDQSQKEKGQEAQSVVAKQEKVEIPVPQVSEETKANDSKKLKKYFSDLDPETFAQLERGK